jgi:hypothetical protein
MMKNFSTAACASLCILTASSLFTAAANAQDAAAKAGPASVSAPAAHCAFLPNAPDQHKVVKGDTLWDISGKFLQNPWCWPEVWGINKDEIRDPHWIYPGQIVYFDRAAGRLRLGTPTGTPVVASMPNEASAGEPLGTVRLSPQVRMQVAARDAIPAIRADAIEPFLTRPLIVQEHQLKNAPVIMSTPEGRVYLSRGDQAYVRGDLKDVQQFQVFRPGQPLRDPVTRKVIAFEAAYLGIVKLDRAARDKNEAHRFVVIESHEEMGVGDRLIPIPPAPIMNYMPHAPARRIDARIVSIYGGGTQAGQDRIVAINRGSDDGLDIGSVLELQRFGQTVRDSTNGNKPVKLPDRQYGSLFVFRIFDKVSYGLVMQVSDAVVVGDLAKTPE